MKTGDCARLLWPPEGSEDESAIALTEDRNFVVIVERLEVPTLGWVYRLDGYPGLHEERYLEKIRVEDVQHAMHFGLTPELPLGELAIEKPFVFEIGEIIQVADVDDEDMDISVSYAYGVISALGVDRDGLYYVVGLRNEQGRFIDSSFEFDEDELLKVPEEVQAELRGDAPSVPRLTLAITR